MVVGLGHELGNHTWSHPDLAALDEAGVRVEIERCRDLIAAATGGPGAFFRPSQAQHATPAVRRAATAAGYSAVLSYDVDSRDFTDPGAAVIRKNAAAVTAGGVVSLHLGHPGHAGRPSRRPGRPRGPRAEARHRLGAVRVKGPVVSARSAAGGIVAAVR